MHGNRSEDNLTQEMCNITANWMQSNTRGACNGEHLKLAVSDVKMEHVR